LANSVTTTQSTTTATQTGFKLVVGSQSNTVTVGSFATDVSLQPYIANRVISFFAYNMRPNQRMHIFFDSVNVDNYCAPSTRDGSNNYSISTITSTSDFNTIPKNGDWGTAVYSDSRGIVAGQFNIPASTFKTGDRLLQISDVDSLVYGSSAYTTMSSAYFTASNLNVTKQAVTLTTVNPEISYVPVVNTVITTTTNVVIKPIPDTIKFTIDAWEPIAQSLTINTPGGESGIFATSLDIFFKQKAQISEHGVTVYLCEVNNGYPDGNNILPFSTVHKKWEEINVSQTATSATNFKFEAPVFLSNGKQYAFIVKPDANDPDYYVWSANLGDTDVNSGYQVFSQPSIGTAFYGATTVQWTALQTEYIKFILNRASFLDGIGDAYFYNTNAEYISVQNISYVNNSVGILSGDYIYQSTNSLANSTGGTVNTSIKASVEFYDSVKNIVYTSNSTGNFQSNTFVQIHRFSNSSGTPNNLTLIAYANTGYLYNPAINALVPQLATISPPGTTLDISYKGTSNTYTIDSNEYKVNPGYETEFYDQERIVASKSNEVSSMSSAKSMTLRARMTTDTEYLSPVVDTIRKTQLAVKNDIDPIEFNYDEFFNSGSERSKYISKIITLAEGQDAEDIQIILSAFRPVNSDIQVWVKFLNGEDQQLIDQKTWTPLYNNSPDLYSDPSNPDDFREFVFGVGSFYTMMSTNGTITSSNTSNSISGTLTYFTNELSPGWYINMRPSQQNLLNNTPFSVKANTQGFSNTSDVLFINNSSSYITANNRVKYVVPTDNTAITGLTANTYYYVSYVNTTAIAVSLTDGGANVDITSSNTTSLETHSIYVEKLTDLNEQTRKVISITSNTSLILDAPFVGNYTNQPYFKVPPPSTPWLSESALAQISGTVTANSGTNIVTGSGTNFTDELKVGSILSIADDSQVITGITNSISLSVGVPWSSNVTGANAYSVSPAGVTYLNENLNLYTTFKQFQIKIILQSDDSSKVPIIDDLRVLALQL